MTIPKYIPLLWIILSPIIYLLSKVLPGYVIGFLCLYLPSLFVLILCNPKKIKTYIYRVVLLVLFLLPLVFLAMLSQLSSYGTQGKTINPMNIGPKIAQWLSLSEDEILFATLAIFFYFVAFFPYMAWIDALEYWLLWTLQGITYSAIMWLWFRVLKNKIDKNLYM